MQWRIREYEVVDSTNLQAERLLSRGEGEGLVVIAGQQTEGRGRRGNSWWSLPGRSLLASVALAGIGGGEASRVVATSTIAAIVNGDSEAPLIKWPNDLVYGRKKVGGLLSVSSRHADRLYTVVGIGLNLNYEPREMSFSARLSPTSLLIEQNRTWDPAALLRSVLRELSERLDWTGEERLREYRHRLAYVGEMVTVESHAGACLSGTLEGVDFDGSLLLSTRGRSVRLGTGVLLTPLP